MAFIQLSENMLKAFLEFHFIYLGNKEIYRIFTLHNLCSISTKYWLFHIFIFFC